MAFRVFSVGRSENRVFQYDISVESNIGSGKYRGRSLDVSGQFSTEATGLALSSDGSNLYVANMVDDRVYQYTLSTPWDVSTGSYASKSIIATEGTQLRAVRFSSDGTKMYGLDVSTDRVYQYTLSTPWDVSTGSYDSKSLAVGAQDDQMLSFSLSDDGATLYAVGNVNDAVYQYTLSTPWDVSTGSYASKSVSVAAQDTALIAVLVSEDKMYVCGDDFQRVYQYTLSTPWDVSTGSYDSTFLPTGSEGTDMFGLDVSPSGPYGLFGFGIPIGI